MSGSLSVPQFVDAPSSQPGWVRAANALGRRIPLLRRPSAEAWWAEARRGALADCEPTPEAREALDALAASIEHEARLNLVGRISARSDTLRLARTHLRIHRALRKTPEIEATPLPPLVFIVGWPRTGTTFLHHLLARDPRNRTLPYWESFDPVPPGRKRDRRVEELRRMLRFLELLAPDYQAIHPMTPTDPEECVALFMNEFRTLQFDFQYRAPGYVDWLFGQDPRIAYSAYHRQLKLVQFHRPAGERFILKDPTHLVHLETLIDLFPDARFIFTHRDPAAAISSICSLMAHTRAIFSDEVDPREIGREVLSGYWPPALDRARELRTRLAPDRIADVRHADLARDPVATVRGLYDRLDLPFDEGVAGALGHFVERQHAMPRHRHIHSPDGFGLRTEAIRDRFKEYREEFDLE